MSYAPLPSGQQFQPEPGTPQESLQRAVEETARRRGIYAEASAFLGLTDPRKLCPYLRNFWRGPKDQPPLTDQELFQGIAIVARFRLDPVSREVTVTRGKDGRLLTIIQVDGWVKVLDRTEGYDGFTQELHFSDPEEQNLVWVETKIYSKLRQHPAVYRAYWQEYTELGGRMKATIPWHMLRIFSLRHAARLFTPIGGSVVTEEEAKWAGAHIEPQQDEPEAPPADRSFAAQVTRQAKRRKRAEQAPGTEPAPADAQRPGQEPEPYDEPAPAGPPETTDNPF